ncbi:heterokaryon incompatibility protein-domain-containing protein [Suillus lakei]|nr:heterokaryon incompatibility protein-domain-containing protein [Suillus lakei]
MPEALQEVLEEFTRYINNDIPFRLLSLPKMEFVDRSDVKQHFRPQIDEITDDMIDKEMETLRNEQEYTYHLHPDRRSAIRALVGERVKYGILSHRWLDKGEPTYKDLQATKRKRSTPGYAKLERFCAVARDTHGMDFTWSDTCCIDKSSSAELDESIRSMFRWYRNSAICIVHLARSTSTDDMTEDEWFRRAWTLQELLAPKKTKFYNKDWKPLDYDKDEKNDVAILSAISKCTGISIRNLLHFDPGPFFLKERMEWAAKRKATRDEDIAYSLTGIFNVGVQIAYGEGAERAFVRLIEALMQVTSDTDILHWAGEAAVLPHTHALPPSPAAYDGATPISGSRPRDRFAMTSSGFRIQLAVFPSRLMSTDQGVSTLTCDLPGMHKVELKVVILEKEALKMQADDGYKWMIGVFNYIGTPEEPKFASESGCYLLMTSSLSAVCIKLPTKNVITFKMGEMVFDKKYLQTVYL